MADWSEAALGEVADIVIGRTPPRAKPEYWTDKLDRPFCSIADMTSWLVEPRREGVSEQAEIEGKAKRVPKGALLMSFKLTIGRVGFAATDVFPNEAIAWLRIKSPGDVDAEFLAHYLSAYDYASLAGRAAKGQTLNSKSLAAIPIALPPVGEQSALAQAMARFIDLYAKHSDHLTKARQLIESVCARAWNEPGRSRLDELGTTVTGQTPPTSEPELWEPPEVPFVAPGDFDGLVLGEVARRVSRAGAERVRSLPANSVMQVCIGATLGKVAVLPQPAVTNQQVNAVVGLDEVDAHFLAGVLSAPQGQAVVKSRAGMNTMPIIKKSAWSRVEVPWPNRRERERLAEMVKRGTAVANAATHAQAATEQLRAALLREFLAGGVELPTERAQELATA
jgi:type I restriction enzyme S subunit